MTAPTQPDLFAVGLRAYTMGPSPITRDIVSTTGSMANIVNTAGATMGAVVGTYAEQLFGAGFLDTAISQGDEVLDRYAWERHGLTRPEASAAVVALSFSRTTTSAGYLDAGFQVSAGDGLLFRTLAALPLPEGDMGPWTVDAICVESGIAGNVDVGSITTIVSETSGQELEVTNAEAAAGGSEPATNAEFGELIRRYPRTLEKGTLAAIRGAVLEIGGVNAALVENIVDGNGEPTGYVRVAIADAIGGANAALARRVKDVLLDVRGGGIPIVVDSSVPVLVKIDVSGVSFRSGFDTAAVLSEARSRIKAAVNALDPMEPLRRAAIVSALQSTRGLVVPDGSVLRPVGDVVPTLDEGLEDLRPVLRTSDASIQINGATG